MKNPQPNYLRFFTTFFSNKFIFPIILLFFPVLLLVVNHDWLIFENPFGGYVDSWVNTGYFLNFESNYHNFGQLYYGDRVPWNFSGYLLFHLFPPLLAHTLLHIIFFSVALISLYYIASRTLGKKTGFFISLMMGGYIFFIREIGSNYIAGAGITFFLLTMLFLTLVAHTTHWKIYSFFVGIFFASMIYTQIFLVFFTPFLLLYFLFVNKQWNKHDPVQCLLYICSGFFIITLIFALIHFMLTGNPFFFSAQINAILYYSNPATQAFTDNLKAHLLIWQDSRIIPEFSLLGCVVFLITSFKLKIKNSNFSYFFLGSYIVAFLCFFIVTEVGWHILEIPFYNGYLIPLMFLGFGAQISIILERISSRHILWLSAISTIILISPFVIFSLPIFSSIFLKYFSSVGLIIIIGIIPPIFFYFQNKDAQQNQKRNLCYVIILCILFATFNSCLLVSSPYTSMTEFNKIDTQENGFLAVLDSVQIINEVSQTQKIRFWYNINETPYGGLYGSINSVYCWMSTYISLDFPDIDKNRFDMPFYWPSPAPTVVLLSTDPGIFEKAQQSLNPIGYNATMISVKPVARGNINFNLTFINIQKSDTNR